MLAPNQAGNRKGATAVEFSVVFMVFITMVFGIIEFGRYFMVVQITKNAAREIARKAAVKTNDSITEAELMQLGLGYMGAPVINSLSDGKPQIKIAKIKDGVEMGGWGSVMDYGDLLQVTISGTYKPLFGTLLIGGKTIPILTSVSVPSEGN